MLERIITWCLAHRLATILGTLAIAVAGFLAMQRLDIDAFPDTTTVQVQINTVAPALAPETVEQRITAPIEQAISGLPGLEELRSVSKFALSQVVAVFDDDTDIWLARQVLTERLAQVELPEGCGRPALGPVASGLGEVFHYVVRGKTQDLTELRTLQEWVLEPVLKKVPGVAEVNSWGGYEKQYQIRLDLQKLRKHRVTYSEVTAAVRANNLAVGGGTLSANGGVTLVQGEGRVATVAAIEAIVVKAHDGVPLRLRDLGEVTVGHQIRRGACTADGKGEVVLGLGFMLLGENSHEVTARLERALAEVRQQLPPGVEAVPVYERTELVDQVLTTVKRNLFEGGLLVIAVLFVLLGSLRAGMIVAAAIPLSLLCAFLGMDRFKVAGTLMSLGALDFGLVVDSSVILVENVMRRLRLEGNTRPRLEIVREATLEVRRPTLYGELIIALVYLPILTLEGIEGKMFRPMAATVLMALLGSMVFSLTLMPVLASLLLPKKPEAHEPWLVLLLRGIYAPLLRLALRQKAAVLLLAGSALFGAALLARGLGAEFVPRLAEGALALNVVRLPGTDLDEGVRHNTAIEQALLARFPAEIRHVWSRVGSAEVATDPMGVELTDLFLTLYPRAQWRVARTQAELTELVRKELREFLGAEFIYSQPIEMRVNEMIAGVRGDVAVKIFGDDLALLASKAQEVEAILHGIEGVADLSTEVLTGQPVLEVRVDPEQSARHGVPAADVLDLVEAVGNKPLGEIYAGVMRFPLVARLSERDRKDEAAIASIPVVAADGDVLPLEHMATIERREGPATISREWGQRRIVTQCNVVGRDLGSFVAEAQRKVAEGVTLPLGRWRIEWGGQFEHLERARLRLLVVVPTALLLILVLLQTSLRSWRLAGLVFSGVPLAIVGGVLALWLGRMPFSIAAAVGFIALSGVAVLNGLVVVTFIRQLRARGAGLEEAVIEGSLARLRPVVMTALVAALGFVPMVLAQGMGAEVQRPLAAVVIGGILSSTGLTLFVLPVLYAWFEPKSGPGSAAGASV